MSDQVVNLLVQIPLAGVIVVVVMIFLRFIQQMFTEFLKSLAAITTQLEALTKTIQEHHSTTLALYNNLRAELGGRRSADKTQPFYTPSHVYHEET